MQTFLPYASFEESARVLDSRRLGKQRVEALQIMKGLFIPDYPWKKHPAVIMWRGYEDALMQYYDAMVIEWKRRGYNNTMELTHMEGATLPPWIGYAPFHASHRSNLLRKDPAWYGKFGWTEKDNLPYVWPSKMVEFIERNV